MCHFESRHCAKCGARMNCLNHKFAYDEDLHRRINSDVQMCGESSLVVSGFQPVRGQVGLQPGLKIVSACLGVKLLS